ncbi:carbohydrate ABC transporter permease [Paenibacillus sp. WQ 127069]|uniref:Carbohydrate ABC transporter permease n=1 Tax=Paenibacillus baimaensis TaxID=2982185 RepID=A0ABT2UAX5_9BACL|nr:carbohydrate ABC transporter permease [Paenibacillus sp. WQ 127069]MCU6791790.1 carbohydrate ABC transporter permease [Paenibacillus sp. WQ 127069]
MRNKKGSFIAKATGSYLTLLVLIVFSVFPALWMFVTSIKTPEENFSIPPTLLAEHPTFANYSKVLTESGIPRAFINSIIVTCSATAVTLVIAILAGYGFARYRFRGSNIMSSGLLYGQMMPGVVIIIPLYMVFSKINLIDTYLAMIIADLAITVPMAVIMLRSFFETLPRELEEAAKLDGLSSLGTLIRIIIPVSMPGIIAVSMYAFLNIWEEFLFALNLTNSDHVRTLPIAINYFSGEFVIDWGAMMSASMIVSMPVLIIFLLCNKFFVKGLSDGSVKG